MVEGRSPTLFQHANFLLIVPARQRPLHWSIGSKYDQGHIFNVASYQGETPVPYPAGHRDEVKKKIMHSARRLFNRHGFDGVSVDQIMAEAGLTRGGFYSYFDSKSDLYAEALACFFTDSEWNNSWEGVDIDLGAADSAAQIVRAYLSRQHFEDVENSCPMVALPSDVARSGKAAKQAFEKVFQAMVGVLERGMTPRGRRNHGTAQAIAALCVGGMVVARSMN